MRQLVQPAILEAATQGTCRLVGGRDSVDENYFGLWVLFWSCTCSTTVNFFISISDRTVRTDPQVPIGFNLRSEIPKSSPMVPNRRIIFERLWLWFI